MKFKLQTWLWLVFLSASWCASAQALEPSEVLVVANANAAKSRGLALYYLKKRQIPEKNLVLVFMTDSETCTRAAYEKKAMPPIRRFLDQNPQIRAIVTVFGVPLRIASPGPTPAETSRLAELQTRQKTLEDQLAGDESMSDALKKETQGRIDLLKKKGSDFRKRIDKVAAFDSELALIKRDQYDLNMWLPNPYYLGFKGQNTEISRSEVMMVSRLDGASDAIVKRIVNDSIEAEQTGLKGNACFDARWKDPGQKNVSGYAFYDRSIHEAAGSLARTNKIPVVLNDAPGLFQKGDCPDTALYCGWYSLARYVDAFTWARGSVGYHIASSECATLKADASQVWCKKMLDKGIAATIGPVGEPYVQSFPVPQIFFKYLSEGYLTLGECYLISLPYLSWKMVLVGDPLYRVNLNP